MAKTKDPITVGGPGHLVCFSYADVLEPKHNDETGLDDYGVLILIPKTDQKTYLTVRKEIDRFKTKLYGDNAPFGFIDPLKDGDEYRSQNTGKPDPVRAGCYYISAKTHYPPDVRKLVARKMLKAETKDDFYSGCYGIAAINFYNFDKKGKKGISAGLSSCMKIKDGERLDGSTGDADKDYSNIDLSAFDADQDSFDEDVLDVDSDDLPF